MVKDQARRKVSSLYMALAVVSCVCLVASNILVSKRLTYGFTGGLLLFPITYIIGDVTTEVYGFKAARRIIVMGFLMNFVVALAGAVAAALPGVENDPSSLAVDTIFHIDGGMAMIVLAASMISFLCGSLANAKVMQLMHNRDGERLFTLRAILSTIVGEGVDSLIFFPIAFFGVIADGYMSWADLGRMMLFQVSLKTLYEVVALPVTLRVVRVVKQLEDESDH
ncbi:MAG: queuosine precursor transporter [Bacteroidales bacterium]|nr:queuosine precursor transporter [Bacteroidales bacterium]